MRVFHKHLKLHCKKLNSKISNEVIRAIIALEIYLMSLWISADFYCTWNLNFKLLGSKQIFQVIWNWSIIKSFEWQNQMPNIKDQN